MSHVDYKRQGQGAVIRYKEMAGGGVRNQEKENDFGAKV